MVDVEYTDEDKAAIQLAANALERAQKKMQEAAAHIEKIARHDKEYGGWALQPYKDVMWLVGEDAAGAMLAENGGDHMAHVIRELNKVANS